MPVYGFELSIVIKAEDYDQAERAVSGLIFKIKSLDPYTSGLKIVDCNLEDIIEELTD